MTEVVRTKAKPPALVAAKTDSLAVDADGDGRVSPGDTLSYEVKVTNVGAGPASDVRFTDTPDRNTTLLAGSVQGATVARGNQPGDTSVDARIGTLAAGAGATLSFQVKIANPLPLGVSVVRNQGQVSSAELGPVLSHDPDSSTTGGMTQTKVALPPVAPPKLGTVGPADGTTVTEPVPVTAGIEPPLGQGIERWCVRYRLAGEPENAARELECGTGTPTGTLATFDPTVLPNGAYIVTVDALSTSGGGIRSNVTLSVEGELKPGRVEQSYEDLALPMANLPMRVLRNYDSFEKRSRDFGHGWSVELSNIRVQVNRELGRGGWSHQATGCSVLLGQNVCLSKAFKDLSSHFVTVTWPDGRSEVFDFTPTAGSGGIYYDASAAFTPRSGATSKLVPEGDPTLQYWGDGNLYEGDGLTLYDPKRFRLTASDGTTYVLETGRGLISAEDRHGNTVRVDADGVTASTGASIKFTRDAQGRITKLTGPSGEQRTYGYDAAGDLVSVTDSRGKTSRYVYDNDHNLTRAEDPDGKPIRRIAYDADGRMSSITDGDGVAVDVDIDVAARRQVMTAGGLTTIVDQDADGNVTSTTEVADGISRTTRHEYDSAGNRIRTVDPRGKETRATFDTAGNLLSATDATGRTKRFAYDANNKLVKVTEPDGTVSGQITYDESGDPIVVEHGGGMTTTSTYDGAGRIATTADAMGRTTRYTHDAAGNVETITDPAGGVARFTYDASGRIRTVRDALGALTTYEWDGDGHMVKRTGARAGDVRSFEYDARGRTVAEVDALGKRTTYAYDDASRVSSSTDRNGDTTTFAYDTIGRLQRAGDTTYAYDGFGRMTAAENADARVAFAYDVADRMTGITTTPVSGPATAITYGYDDGGRRTSVTAPWGRSTLSYDPAGQLATLADPVNGTFRWERDAAGRLTKLIRPNGVTSSTSYNLAGQKTAVTHTAASGALVDEARYAYNAGGMPEQVTDRLGTHTYTYDVAGQLTQAVHPAGQPSESYSYDLMGNRTSNGEVYDAAGRLRADAQRTYEYDHEGQLLARTDKATGATTRYAWRDGKLRKVTAADGGVTTYRYDPLGRRIEVSGPAGVVRFGYGSEDNASVEYDAAGARTAVHTFGPVLDQPLATRRGTQSYYPLQEGLVNTVTSVTNSTGAAVERFAYGAFGQPQTGNPRPGATGFSYTAREHDAAAGAYYVRARYLDPEIGRFISEDPLPAGNAYAYAGNSPIAHWDPTGLYTMSEINAERAVEADIRAGYNVGEYGFIYRFMRAAKAMNQASHDLYIGITNNIARRSAQHTAQGYVRGNIAEIELHLSGRIQLRALEQARMLARGGKDELANAINSMSQKNWDKIGKELVESWYQRSLNNPNVPQRMLDDVAKVLDPDSTRCSERGQHQRLHVEPRPGAAAAPCDGAAADLRGRGAGLAAEPRTADGAAAARPARRSAGGRLRGPGRMVRVARRAAGACRVGVLHGGPDRRAAAAAPARAVRADGQRVAGQPAGGARAVAGARAAGPVGDPVDGRRPHLPCERARLRRGRGGLGTARAAGAVRRLRSLAEATGRFGAAAIPERGSGQGPARARRTRAAGAGASVAGDGVAEQPQGVLALARAAPAADRRAAAEGARRRGGVRGAGVSAAGRDRGALARAAGRAPHAQGAAPRPSAACRGLGRARAAGAAGAADRRRARCQRPGCDLRGSGAAARRRHQPRGRGPDPRRRGPGRGGAAGLRFRVRRVRRLRPARRRRTRARGDRFARLASVDARETDALECLGLQERRHVGDALAAQCEHAQGVRAMVAGPGVQLVVGERELPVHGDGRHPPVELTRHRDVAQEAGDGFAAAIPRRSRRHRERDVVGEHGHDGVDVAVLPRLDVLAGQLAQALVAERAQCGLLARLWQPLVDRLVGALERAVDGGRRRLERLGHLRA